MIAYILLAAATANTPATATPATPAPVKKERLICKSDRFVGSHISQRICKTEAEWQAAKQKAQEALDDRGRGGNYRAPGTSGN